MLGSVICGQRGRDVTLGGCVQGLSCFHLLQDTACCPMCQGKVKPGTCAFVGCAWMYDGRKLGPDGAIESCSSSWQVGLRGSSSLPWPTPWSQLHLSCSCVRSWMHVAVAVRTEGFMCRTGCKKCNTLSGLVS